jgi:hypothetical protein
MPNRSPSDSAPHPTEPHPAAPHPTEPEPYSLEQLLGDCRRFAGPLPAPLPPRSPAPPLPGIRVPSSSARLLDGMSDYGDRPEPARRRTEPGTGTARSA